MSRLHVGRLSPALVVSFVALLVALGGTSYAAFSLPRNSVGTRQLKNGAVTNKKLAKGAVSTSKIASGTSVPNALHANTADTATSATNATNAINATNATNASNASNATNANSAASATDAAKLGGAPASTYEQYGATLPSGQTETGAYEMGINYGAGGGVVDGAISFARRLAAAPTPHFIPSGSVAPSQCPGTASAPAAQAGNLCVYEVDGSDTSSEFINTTTGAVGASVFGAGLRIFAGSSGELFSEGTWAVTG
jgi:hypothetical protein